MPGGLQLKESDPGNECFPFVLTTAEGDKLYGTCLCFHELASPEFLKSNSIEKDKGGGSVYKAIN